MNGKRTYFVFIGLLLLLIAGMVGGTYAANSILSKEAAKLGSLKAKVQAQEQQQLTLAKVKKDIQKYAELKQITDAVVPEDKNQAAAVREIVKIADTNNVKLSSITFPASTLGNTTAKPGAAAATTATPKPVPLNSKTNTLSQLTPVSGIAGVYELTILIQNDSSNPVKYDQFLGFLRGLEQNRRTAQVSTISIQPVADNRNYLTFNLSVTEYIKP